MRLLTIEEYLALEDWKFCPFINEGQEGEFFWFTSSGLFYEHPLTLLPAPREPFRIAIIDWDSTSGAESFFSKMPDWCSIGDWAVSPPLTSFPALNFHADAEVIVFPANSPNELLLEVQQYFGNSVFEMLHSDEFWDVLKKLKPLCYTVTGSVDFFIAPNQSVYSLLMNSELLINSETKANAQAERDRQICWENLGPEVGPERCLEPDCDRLRIKLAVRCFIHQLQHNGQLQDNFL